MESKKIPTVLTNKRISMAVYPAGKKQITLFNQNKFPELYSLYGGKKEILSYREISNQFIHSSIFAPFIPYRKSLLGFFLASDQMKKSQLYYITLVKIIEIFRAAGNGYLMSYEVDYDVKKKMYVVSKVEKG